MENDNKEIVKNEETRRSKYEVHIKYDKKILKTFAKFSNRVRHPLATAYMLGIGIMLFALPFVNHDIKLAGVIVCYVMGPILILLALFRHNISVLMMKDSPEMRVGEDIIYQFGNTGVQVKKSGEIEHMGNYKKIYRLWEDEKHFYIGMNEDDLLVLPKDSFEEGDEKTFRDFITDKSRCIFTWQPTRIDHIIKWKLFQFQTRNERKIKDMKDKDV